MLDTQFWGKPLPLTSFKERELGFCFIHGGSKTDIKLPSFACPDVIYKTK